MLKLVRPRANSLGLKLFGVKKPASYTDVSHSLEQPIEIADTYAKFVVKRTIKKGIEEERILKLSTDGIAFCDTFTEEEEICLSFKELKKWKLNSNKYVRLMFSNEHHEFSMTLKTANQAKDVDRWLFHFSRQSLDKLNQQEEKSIVRTRSRTLD